MKISQRIISIKHLFRPQFFFLNGNVFVKNTQIPLESSYDTLTLLVLVDSIMKVKSLPSIIFMNIGLKTSENADCNGLDIFNVWTTTGSPRDFTSRPGGPRTTWKNVIQRDLRRLVTDWPTEEAEAAAHDRSL